MPGGQGKGPQRARRGASEVVRGPAASWLGIWPRRPHARGSGAQALMDLRGACEPCGAQTCTHTLCTESGPCLESLPGDLGARLASPGRLSPERPLFLSVCCSPRGGPTPTPRLEPRAGSCFERRQRPLGDGLCSESSRVSPPLRMRWVVGMALPRAPSPRGGTPPEQGSEVDAVAPCPCWGKSQQEPLCVGNAGNG